MQLDARSKLHNPPGPHAQATPHEKGSAVDLYYDSLFYRRTTENMEQYFGRETSQMSVYGWVRGLSKKADAVLRPMKVNTSDVWVADGVVVRVLLHFAG